MSADTKINLIFSISIITLYAIIIILLIVKRNRPIDMGAIRKAADKAKTDYELMMLEMEVSRVPDNDYQTHQEKNRLIDYIFDLRLKLKAANEAK